MKTLQFLNPALDKAGGPSFECSFISSRVRWRLDGYIVFLNEIKLQGDEKHVQLN